MARCRLFAAVIGAGLVMGALGQAVAQSPPAPAPAPAPGAGHGFLIDKHIAAGLSCNACHAENPPAKTADQSACIKCHGTYKDLAAKTGSDQPNPHESHLGDIPCASCHHVHQASVTYCAQCHNFDLKTP